MPPACRDYGTTYPFMQISIGFIVVYLAVCVILAVSWAAKKRIGDGWGFFFLFFWGVIPGIIVISASPSKTRLKELKDGSYGLDKPLGFIGIALAAFDLLALFKMGDKYYFSPEDKTRQMIYYTILLITFSGFAYYMLTRFKRHERIYTELNNPTKIDNNI